jgi:hypothetical protein
MKKPTNKVFLVTMKIIDTHDSLPLMAKELKSCLRFSLDGGILDSSLIAESIKVKVVRSPRKTEAQK